MIFSKIIIIIMYIYISQSLFTDNIKYEISYEIVNELTVKSQLINKMQFFSSQYSRFNSIK